MILFRIFLFLTFFCLLPSFSHAETIYYNIRQMGFDGQASLKFAGPKEYKGQKTFLIVFKAHGTNYWDEEEIYTDPSTFKPLFVKRDFSLGAFGHGKILEEYKPSKIIITKDEGGHTSTQTIEKSDVDNIYGFIYRYRRQGSFKVGDKIDMHLPTKDVKIELVKKTKLKIDKKYYSAYYLQSQPRKYRIWLDTSEHKWPLRITGSIGFINSVMTMTGHEE